MDVQQENQPERQADARLTQPSFVTISSSPFTSQIIKAIENDRRSENGACDGHGWQRHRTEFSAPSNPISVAPVRGSRYPDRRAWLSPPVLPTRNDAASDACSCPCHRALVRICGRLSIMWNDAPHTRYCGPPSIALYPQKCSATTPTCTFVVMWGKHHEIHVGSIWQRCNATIMFTNSPISFG